MICSCEICSEMESVIDWRVVERMALPCLAAGALGCTIVASWRLCTADFLQDLGLSLKSRFVASNAAQLVGNTPLVRISSLSEATGCEVNAKVEFMNPGGSTKDRVARQVIVDAVEAGKLRPGGYLVEGTSGSTGISLAVLARSLGYRAFIVVQDDVSPDKIKLLTLLGAQVLLVPPVSIVNERHYVNMARRIAASANTCPGEASLASTSDSHAPPEIEPGGAGTAVFCDQFETESNFKAHYNHTGPEIWRDMCGGDFDAFVAGAGTGGTLAGAAAYFRDKRACTGVPALVRKVLEFLGLRSPPRPIHCFLADPPGSSLLNAVLYRTAYARQQSERALKRHRIDTIIEGVGLDRISANFAKALPLLTGAFPCSDAEAVAMARYILRHEGLFIGSSSALCLVGAVQAARALGPGHKIVTLLCDSGSRHISRFWNDELLARMGLLPPPTAGDGSPPQQQHATAASPVSPNKAIATLTPAELAKDRFDLSFVKPLPSVWKAAGSR